MSNEHDIDRELSDALRCLAAATPVPPPDPRREEALLRAFDAAHADSAAARSTTLVRPRRRSLTSGLWLGGLAAAAMLLIAIGIPPGANGRDGTPPGGGRQAQPFTSRGVRPQPEVAGDFVPWPGASTLPPLESGELVRMDLPVTMLPSLGVAPPAGHATVVKADVVIGQDGLARAVRFVAD